MPLIGLPRLQMIAGGQQVETSASGGCANVEEIGHRELLVGEHKTDHSFLQLTTCRPAPILRLIGGSRSRLGAGWSAGDNRGSGAGAGQLQQMAPIPAPNSGIAADSSGRHPASPYLAHSKGNERASCRFRLLAPFPPVERFARRRID